MPLCPPKAGVYNFEARSLEERAVFCILLFKYKFLHFAQKDGCFS